jgi:hypothetical protein
VWVSMQFPYIGALFCDAAALSKTWPCNGTSVKTIYNLVYIFVDI